MTFGSCGLVLVEKEPRMLKQTIRESQGKIARLKLLETFVKFHFIFN